MTANTVTMRRQAATAIAVIVVKGEPTRENKPLTPVVASESSKRLP